MSLNINESNFTNSFNNELTKIYSTTDNGSITFIGNTLGLSKATNSQNAGTANAIGAFITINPTLNVNTYPKFAPGYPKAAGTTLKRTVNASSTSLNLPPDSSILHAELIWGGTCKVPRVDYTNIINKNIMGIFPGDNINVFIPDYVYLANKSADVSVYCCRKDITNMIKVAYNGTYEIFGVVGTIDPNNNSDNCCGWTLAIVYKSTSLPYRNLNLYAGMSFVNSTSPYSLSISDLNTPTSGALSGRLAVCTLGANATIQGDKLLFGPTSDNLHELQGPRNPANNFFGSQINNDLGQTDTLGTFGNQNQDILTNSNIIGGRQGLDITNVDISTTLTNSQTSAIAQFTTTNDNYFPQALGVQVDLSAPNFTGISVNANKTSVEQGNDSLDITLTFRNIGSAPAQNVIYRMNLPPNFSYKDDSVRVNGTPPSGTVDFNTGIELGTIPANSQQFKVTFTLNTKGGKPSYLLNSSFNYKFLPKDSNSPLQKTWYVNSLTIYSWNINNNIDFPFSLNANMGLVDIGDTVTFITNITNNMPIPSNPDNYWTRAYFNVQFPTGMEYKTGTLKINGTSNSASATTGVSLVPYFQFNQPIQIEFQANITNNAPSLGKYQITANMNLYLQTVFGSALTTRSASTYVFQNTVIENVTSGSTFNFNNYNVAVGDTVSANGKFYAPNNYNFFMPMFTIELPNSISYVLNSMVPQISNTSPLLGARIQNIIGGSYSTIEFNIHVDSAPTNDYKYNTSSDLVTHQFVDTFGYLPNVTSYNSTLYYTKVLVPSITTNKSIITPGENQTIEFTIVITNEYNVTVRNTILKNNLPSGLSYVSNSLTVDGVNSSDSLSTGVSLKVLAQYESTTIKFSAKADSQPNNSCLYNNIANVNYELETTVGNFVATSNSASIDIYSSNILTIAISSDKENVIMGKDTIEYTITVTNPYNVTINNLVLTDNLPIGLIFVPSSLIIDGASASGSLSTGVSLKSLTQNQSTIIKFLAKTESAPNTGFQYVNFATINYTIETALGNFLPNSATSNTNKIIISNILIATKSTNKAIVTPKKDQVKFRIIVTNKFNVAVKNVILYDNLPYGLIYKAGTLTIDNVSSNASIETGVPLNIIGQNVPVTIKFLADVYAKSPTGKYSNYATVTYEFEPTPGTTSSGHVITNIVNIDQSSLVINPIAPKIITYMTCINTSIKLNFPIYSLNNSPLSYSIFTHPVNGYALISNEGICTYTPKINFVGLDQFIVLIKDTSSGKTTVTVNIDVKPYLTSLTDLNICKY